MYSRVETSVKFKNSHQNTRTHSVQLRDSFTNCQCVCFFRDVLFPKLCAPEQIYII